MTTITLVVAVDYLAFDKGDSDENVASLVKLPLDGAIQIWCGNSNPNPNPSDSTMIAQPMSISRILGDCIFTKRTHKFHNVVVSDMLYVSVLDESNNLLGRGSISLQLAKKNRLQVPLYNTEHRLVCVVHCKIKWDDFDSKESYRTRIAHGFVTLFSLMSSAGWILYSTILILFVLHPYITKDSRFYSYSYSYPYSPGLDPNSNSNNNRLLLRPGMTLFQGDYIIFCQRRSLISSCEKSYFYLSEKGILGIYTGSGPMDKSSTIIWQHNSSKSTGDNSENDRNNDQNILKKIVGSIVKFIRNDGSSKEYYRVLLNYEDELVLLKGKKVLWKSKALEITALREVF